MKGIVTTTINPITLATHKFAEIAKKHGWLFIIVGDKKTPHNVYQELEKQNNFVIYLTPEKQDELYPSLSNLIGWNSIQRRNIGLKYAYDLKFDIIATVDDDNIPYDNWGENLYVNKTIEVNLYEPVANVFDPLSITKENHLWHRGYPIELLNQRHLVEYKGKIKRHVLIQADLWDGDPDIDAMARLTYKSIVKFSDIKEPFCSNKISPFNSQNTFLSREIIPYYSVLPFIGRMDDIWGGYITQNHFKDSLIYGPPSVYQDRNKQDLITNLEKEIIGYRNTLQLIDNLLYLDKILPKNTLEFYNEYIKSFK